MFCPKCGQPNPDDVANCTKCGAYLVQTNIPQAPKFPNQAPQQPGMGQPGMMQPPPGVTKPSNNLILAIISTICCGCLPLGIVAIVFATQVDSKWNRGDFSGAQDSSKKALIFSIISIVLAVIGGIIYLISVAVFMNSPQFQQQMKQIQEQQKQQMQQPQQDQMRKFNNKGAANHVPDQEQVTLLDARPMIAPSIHSYLTSSLSKAYYVLPQMWSTES